jgi:hypothetical protein
LNRGDTPEIVVCQEVCDAAYDNCRFSDGVFDKDNIKNGTALCEDIFDDYGFRAVVVPRSTRRTCYYGTQSYFDVSQQVGICLNSVYGASSTIVASIASVLLMVILSVSVALFV